MASMDDAGCPDQESWQLLALSDRELEKVDLIVLNLTVARGIPALSTLDIEQYRRIVDGWTEQFSRRLLSAERSFHQTPSKWKHDIWFFRVGMLAGFLGHEVGINYIDEQKHAQTVRYTNPSDLFLNGLIDSKTGTCGNMAALHVAIARRMSWPVSLAAVGSHFISRYDDGKVHHNIEVTDTHPGAFASGADDDYIRRQNLPRKAITCGSDLRRLSAREMLGTFLALRARHFVDVGNREQGDLDYSLGRILAPTLRRVYIGAMGPMVLRGAQLFEPGELGHPNSLLEDLAPIFAANASFGTPLPPSRSVCADSAPRAPSGVYSIGKLQAFLSRGNQ